MFFWKKTEKKFRIIKVNVYLCRIKMDSVTYQVTIAFNRFFKISDSFLYDSGSYFSISLHYI
ncbi:hypothetical protein JCM6292_1436 [Bacteroides pyogenes JCM 6292]|uniref:Uncharacterized protein n=1 Tax=Bacteroides pyogenes JCM 6292 TaxID=1235809 RepID=W4P5Y4_9BACE|nr:hypothetical protein JCM6292_1436 [Bacteroides pyogenes JCM 6292]